VPSNQVDIKQINGEHVDHQVAN